MRVLTESLFHWALGELALSALLFAGYRAFERYAQGSSDRAVYLKAGFVVLLALPFLPAGFFSLPLPKLGGEFAIELGRPGFAPLLVRLPLVLTSAYLAGLCFRASRLARSFLELRALLAEAERWNRPTRWPVYLTARAVGPMTAGVFASKILLPKRLLSELSERELAAVLDHEFTHAERRDGAFNFLRLLVRDLLWFSPFAAWLARRFEENMELSVDSTVLAHGAITARSYAEMLLRLSGEGELEALPAAHMSRHFIFRRIAAMKLPAKSAGTLPSRRWVTRASVLAFFLLGLAGYSVFGIASPARADSIRMVRYEVLKFECNNGLLTCQSLIGTEFVYQLSQECGCGGPAGVENFLHYKRYP